MKKRIILFYPLFACFFMFFGCKNINKSGQNTSGLNDELSFSSISIAKKIHLFNDTTMPGCSFSLDLIYPENKEKSDLDIKKLQELFTKFYLGGQYAPLSPEQATNKYTADYIDNYLELEKEYDKNSSKNDNVWMNYEQIISSKILYNENDFISYEVDSYTYTGGAHGMSPTTFQVIDLKRMEPIVLSDIFDEIKLADVANLIKNNLAKQLGYTSTQQLEEVGYDVNEIKPTENFYIDGKGITWLYNQYEIAAYVMGKPTVQVSYKDLLPYILADSPVSPLI